ncbi:MAG: tungstate ABC transporter substrate-binding protein WtpA [Anaerolineaceae bacterium]|nr:tungstate ABC transporter substrate-binding protein WtpA [Anaerolineaceae bacterium]
MYRIISTGGKFPLNRRKQVGYMKKLIVVLVLLCILTVSGCDKTESTAEIPKPTNTLIQKTPLVVFAAGSLIIPFHELEIAFEKQYPEIDVLAEYHGSIQVMRHVTEMHHQIDVVATADSNLIPMLMYAVDDPETGLPYANWYINFGTNRLALAYTDRSNYTEQINRENWAEILSKPDVVFGLSDPRFDAAGYRSLMAFALQEDYLGQYGLFKNMFNDQFKTPITLFREDELALIIVPEILDTNPAGHVLMRGASIQLIALLESGDIDYAFEYESVIKQHGLSYLILDDRVNLGSFDAVDLYDNVEVKLDFQRFQSVDPQFIGEPIRYGITIPTNAIHSDAATLFIEFLLSDTGREILLENQQPMFETYSVDGYENMPENLKNILTP